MKRPSSNIANRNSLEPYLNKTTAITSIKVPDSVVEWYNTNITRTIEVKQS